MRKVTNEIALLADLLNAQEAQKAVKIRYVKIKTGEVSRRSIEILNIWVDSKGDFLVVAWDRRDQELTTFRMDHITHYTLHRSPKLATYTAQVEPVADEDAIRVDKNDEITGFASWRLTA